MNKLFSPSHTISKSIVFLLLLIPEFIFLLPAFSSDSIDFPRNYKNCIEIQEYMNSVSTKYRYQGFEKSNMISGIEYIYYPYKYRNVLYCNGGKIIAKYSGGDRKGKICDGNIQYVNQRDAIDYRYVEEHYWHWGNYGERHDEKKYCR